MLVGPCGPGYSLACLGSMAIHLYVLWDKQHPLRVKLEVAYSSHSGQGQVASADEQLQPG
jgi:hypothetical protein